ncbi:VTT domain-containing protein [Hydrogenimonas sp.]
MTEILDGYILPFVEQFRNYAAWIAFFAAFGETLIGLGLFVPGSTLLLFLGVLAGQGYLDIGTLLLFGLAGAYLGDIANYRLGRRYGVALLRKSGFPFTQERLEAAQAFMNVHGAKSVFLARFVPGLKEVVPFMAGSLGMRKSRFLVWDFLGAVGWSFEFIGIGYIFSASLALAQVWLSRTLTVVTMLVFLLVLLYLLKRFVVRNAPAARSILHSLWHAFATDERVRAFVESHPKLTAFLRKRLDRSTFFGLPLTLLSLAFFYTLALFGGIVEDLLSKDPIVYADRIIANLVVSWRTPDLTAFFTWITYLGKGEVLLLFLASATLIGLLYRRWNELIALWFSLGGSILFVYLGKLAFHRPRPETALYLESTYSFPSAHALVAVSFYGFIGYLLMREVDHFRTRVNILFATAVLALLIGFSRIYLGEHYLSDVYGGYLLGTLWAIAGIVLLKWLNVKGWFAPRPPVRGARIASVCILLLAAGLYTVFGTIHRYRPAPHPTPAISVVQSLPELFGKVERYTRNILGFQSIPVTLVIATAPDSGKELCNLFKEEGWSESKRRKIVDFPLFWHYESPRCSLFKERNGTIYLLKIWRTPLRYRGEEIHVAAADAVTGFRWGLLPILTEDPGMARDFALTSLKRLFPGLEAETVILGRPHIRKRLFEEPYFDDAKALFIKIPDRTVAPKRIGRRRAEPHTVSSSTLMTKSYIFSR